MRVAPRSAVAAIACAMLVAAASAGPASSDATAAAVTCRGPEVLSNDLALSAKRKVSIKRVTCGAAKKVVTRFAERCVEAYTSQGTCTVRAPKRWRCTSRIVGSAAAGAPSAVSCSSRRSRVGFKVVLVPRGSDVGEAPAARIAIGPPAVGPTDHERCIDATAPGKLVPAPGPPDDVFELRAYGRVPLLFGQAVQNRLVSRAVVRRLLDGLKSRPRNSPGRVPVYLRTGADEGLTHEWCTNTGLDAVVVAIGTGLGEAAQVTAHELVHVFATGLKDDPAYPWFEDSIAEWSTWKAGLFNGSSWEILLQYPNIAPDTDNPEDYRYAFWRFVQFLDDKQLMVAGDGSWPVARASILAKPQMSAGIDQYLRSRETSFGQELAEFWGEHLKAHPRRPPRVKPTGRNATTIVVKPGQRRVDPGAKPLHTHMLDFKLDAEVNRVEFEFEPPADGYFWGLTEPNTSRRFLPKESVSFCVGQPGGEKPEGDDIEWPGHFPVTFTNGLLSGGALKGVINVYAQANSEQCKGGELNRACRLLRAAGVVGLLGPILPNDVGFGGRSGVDDHGRPQVSCAFRGYGGLGVLIINTWKSSTVMRRTITRRAKAAGWRRVHLGDVAYAYDTPDGDHAFLIIAVGRQWVALEVSSNRGPTSLVLQLGRNLMSEIR